MIDQDLLLRLIDAKFDTLTGKVDGVAFSLKSLADSVAQISARYDSALSDHEHRLGAIESELATRKLQVAEFEAQKKVVAALDQWKTEEQTTSRNASKWGAAVWGAVGSAVTAIVGWIIMSYVTATATPAPHPISHPQAQIETRTHTTVQPR